MSYEDFERVIESEALKRVARHWCDIRGGYRMPSWDDVLPSKIAAQLSIIWSYTYDAATDSFTGRLAGLRIEQQFGRSFKGTSMTELYPTSDYPRLFKLTKRVVCEPALYRSSGMVFRHLNQSGYGERVILPLAADGEHGDGVLGATDYQIILGKPTAGEQDRESWCEL